MKLKAKTLIKRFIEIECLKDKGGMDPEVAKDCAKIAFEFYLEHFDSLSTEIVHQKNKVEEVLTKTVNFAVKDGRTL